MSKSRDELKPASFAPAYCALYPPLAELARDHGYALAVHGSLARDFDIVAIPWREYMSPSPHGQVVADIVKRFAIRTIGAPTAKPHGRIAYTLSIGFGSCALDLSFMPIMPTKDQDKDGSGGGT